MSDDQQGFDEVARRAWEMQKTPLEQFYDRWVGEGQWEPQPVRVTFRIYDRLTDVPICCHLCGADDRWFVEGDEVRQIARIFVCEEAPVPTVRGGVRQISTVPVRRVGRIEVTGGPVE